MDKKALGLAADNMVLKLRDARSPVDWKQEFRASSLPFCQLQYLWFKIDEKLEELPGRHESFMSDLFLEMGTGIHNAVQRWLGKLGMLHGFWRCPKCKLVVEGTGTKYCIHESANDVLDKDHDDATEMLYQEFAFDKSDGGPSGHGDGLLKMGDLTPGKNDFVMLEVKSTGTKRLAGIKKDGVYWWYRLQTSVYANKFEAMGYNIVATIYLFVPRDAITKITAIPNTQMKMAKRVYENLKVEYAAAEEALAKEDPTSLVGVCTDKADADWWRCPYGHNCFAMDPHGIFREKWGRYLGKDPREVTTPQFPERKTT